MKLQVHHIQSGNRWTSADTEIDREIEQTNTNIQLAAEGRLSCLRMGTSDNTIVFIPEEILKGCVFVTSN